MDFHFGKVDFGKMDFGKMDFGKGCTLNFQHLLKFSKCSCFFWQLFFKMQLFSDRWEHDAVRFPQPAFFCVFAFFVFFVAECIRLMTHYTNAHEISDFEHIFNRVHSCDKLMDEFTHTTKNVLISFAFV